MTTAFRFRLCPTVYAPPPSTADLDPKSPAPRLSAPSVRRVRSGSLAADDAGVALGFTFADSLTVDFAIDVPDSPLPLRPVKSPLSLEKFMKFRTGGFTDDGAGGLTGEGAGGLTDDGTGGLAAVT